MTAPKQKRATWRELMNSGELQMLPTAHDALAAQLIEKAGFTSYQIGMFAVVGARFGYPDIDLAQFGENSQSAREIIAASNLPVLVDCDDAYGDVKNVAHVITSYEKMGASAVFIEDQASPKRCGHMAGKQVVPAEILRDKIVTALNTRLSEDLFVIARTDSRESLGLDEALRRGEMYFDAGADGLFIEAPHDEKEIEQIASTFRGKPLAVNMLEGGGRTPLIPPADLHAMGFSMLFLPTSLIFVAAKAIQSALISLKAGTYPVAETGFTFAEYEDTVNLPYWAELESTYLKHQEKIDLVSPEASQFSARDYEQ